MIIEPRLDEPVEFLELVFGAGFWRTVFEPAQHVSFDQVARHARMLSVDALHRLLDRCPDDLAGPGVDAGMFQCVEDLIECLDRLLSLGGVHPFEKAFDEGIVLQGMLCAPLVHRMRIAPLVTAVARLTIDSGAMTRDSTS